MNNAKQNLAENNMLFRQHDIVKLATPQDDEHAEFINSHDTTKLYTILRLDEEKETYRLQEAFSVMGEHLLVEDFTDSDLVLFEHKKLTNEQISLLQSKIPAVVLASTYDFLSYGEQLIKNCTTERQFEVISNWNNSERDAKITASNMNLTITRVNQILSSAERKIR